MEHTDSHTVRYEKIEVDARMGFAISVEPPILHTGVESEVLEFIGMAKGKMPTRIRIAERDFFPILWTSSPRGGYVESRIERHHEVINHALEYITRLLGNDSIHIPLDQ